MKQDYFRPRLPMILAVSICISLLIPSIESFTYGTYAHKLRSKYRLGLDQYRNAVRPESVSDFYFSCSRIPKFLSWFGMNKNFEDWTNPIISKNVRRRIFPYVGIVKVEIMNQIFLKVVVHECLTAFFGRIHKSSMRWSEWKEKMLMYWRFCE